MFVSMFYGRLDVEQNIFLMLRQAMNQLYIIVKNDQFFTLEAKGLLLGVLSETNYTFHEIVLEENDLIIMMTDGVTEFRVKEELNSREVITTLIKENRHLSAQNCVSSFIRK